MSMRGIESLVIAIRIVTELMLVGPIELPVGGLVKRAVFFES